MNVQNPCLVLRVVWARRNQVPSFLLWCPPLNPLSSLGILFSLILLSLPAGMYNLPKAHVIESSASSRCFVTQDGNRVTFFFFFSKAMINSLARTQSPLHKFQEVWSLPSSSIREEEELPCIVTYREAPATHPVGQA